MYVYISYVHIYICIYIYVYICIYIHTHIDLYSNIYIYLHIQIYTYIYIYHNTCARLRLAAPLESASVTICSSPTSVPAYIYKYIHIYVYTHIQTSIVVNTLRIIFTVHMKFHFCNTLQHTATHWSFTSVPACAYKYIHIYVYTHIHTSIVVNTLRIIFSVHMKDSVIILRVLTLLCLGAYIHPIPPAVTFPNARSKARSQSSYVSFH